MPGISLTANALIPITMPEIIRIRALVAAGMSCFSTKGCTYVFQDFVDLSHISNLEEERANRNPASNKSGVVGRTGTNIQPATAVKIAKSVDNIVAIKEAS